VLKLKPKFNNEEEAYDACVADGYIKKVDAINSQRITSLLKNSDISAESADTLAKTLNQGDDKWLTVYILYYDALRICTEAFLFFDKLNSYLDLPPQPEADPPLAEAS